jgi:hypothetical protein
MTAAGLMPGAAQAGGYGFYLESEFSDASIKDKFSFDDDKTNRGFESAKGGFGFVYDTNVARDEPLNYRVKVGYRHGRREFDDESEISIPEQVPIASQNPPMVPPPAGTKIDDPITFTPKNETVPGLTLNQTLGYGFVRRPLYRIWAGPTLRFNVDWYGVTTDLDVVDLAIGGGPEVGFNYHLSDRLSLSTTLSYNYLYIAEHFETTGEDYRLDGGQHLLAFSINLFYRTVTDRFDN